jgi:hypothetical protein
MRDNTPDIDEVPIEALTLLLRIKTELTRADIEALQIEFAEAGDHKGVDICRDALAGDQGAWCACGESILEERDKTAGAGGGD